MSVERILLTNDDGIDAVGLHALYERLSENYEVTTVAPVEDRSAVGRVLSGTVDIAEHELGYAIEGTPADCVVAGLGTLVPEVDVVVSGCNKGANLGAYTLGRSGTVSAAVEAAFFGVPAIAASLYIPGDEDWWKRELSHAEFAHVTDAVEFLIERATTAGVFETVDYLNVNGPPAESDRRAPMRITDPSPIYDLGAERDGDRIELHDRIWGRMFDGEVPDPVGVDRRAVLDGEVSVSPLSITPPSEPNGTLETLLAEYEPDA
ncbi:5'/3'-nucleotidase SurE [Halorubrum vacuolatum]|uniref:5'-nucleotidase SurE n=1 Tax=Halorubrum vacuolatum TaxID=63740 RepID=A0A238XVY2_HALVU|nr:5'/3'-nucleotidase SurE [Halorubrum vacuolatum]SNR62514.1 5'-nucleotidase /3'-nucleotidase /exopolyphosphatase [Halorubrum vacuolatum]